jgi:protoporphyrinogen oxidase
MRRKYPPQPGQKPRTFFTSFVNGMQELTDRMADAAGREKMRTGVTVAALRHAHGRAWTVLLSDGSTADGDAVIIATESWAAEPLVRPHDEIIRKSLASIPASSSAVSMAQRGKWLRSQFLGSFPGRTPRSLLSPFLTKWKRRLLRAGLAMGFVGIPQPSRETFDEELIQVVLC